MLQIILLLVALAAAYYIYRQPSPRQASQPAQRPLVFRDDDTGQYFIQDRGREPRAISEQEFLDLTNDTDHHHGTEEEGAGTGAGVIGSEDYEDMAGDGFDPELDRANANLPGGGGGPGPATAATASGRALGAKKLKSLARRDQRRAYFEHQRMEALVAREDALEFERQYGDLLAAERDDRRQAQTEAEQARAEELARAREESAQRRREREEVGRRLRAVPEGAHARLATPLERDMAQGVSGAFVVGEEGESQWMVRFSEEQLGELGRRIAAQGEMSFEDVAKELADIRR